MPVSPVIQTGKPPGSRHESLPSHDAPGDFLFDARSINLTAASPTESFASRTTFGMARPFLPADFLNCGELFT
jgi:hypothetical protein